ncbi:MAG TPA: hypothetical protein VF756_15730 [Thermoanaerobaculia bacterium]
MSLTIDDWWFEEELRSPEDSPRDKDEILIFGDVQKPRSEEEVLLEEMLVSSLRRIPLLEPMERQARSIYPHVWELMGMAPAKRRKAVRKPPFRDLSLADLLLNECSKAIQKRSPEAFEYAETAEWIAALPWPEEREKAATIRARAWIDQGRALREARDWAGAELRFGAAFSILREIPVGIITDHSFFCRQLSQLREDQGRLYEAAILHLHAMHLHCAPLGSQRLPDQGLAHLAFLSLKQNDPGRAMSLLTSLCEKEDLFFVGDLELDFGRAICLAALGLAEPARSLLEESLPKRRRIDDREARLPYEWIECRISVHLGDLDRAIPRLEALRRWLIEHREIAAITLSSIDLALAHAKKGEAAQRFPGLLNDLAREPGAAEQPWALGALWGFREALEQGQDPAVAARKAAEIVHRREKSVAHLAL